MNVLDLFSGIGGFSLGLERAGMKTVAFCEIEPYCRRVLEKHWPRVPCYDDIRTLTAERLRADGITVDLVCGGFPCQPFSVAGKQLGAADDRHLWPEYFRLIKELRPSWVVGENVVGLINLGLDNVLSDLESAGYTARTLVIPAVAVDAKHRRDRAWIVAYASDNTPERFGQHGGKVLPEKEAIRFSGGSSFVADTKSQRLERRSINRDQRKALAGFRESGRTIPANWLPEPAICRVAHGIPNRAHRLRGLGNAVVPQIPEIIGRAILKADAIAKQWGNL